MNKFIGLDGKEIHFEEVEKGVFKEVEKQELIGGVFEEGETVYYINMDGDVISLVLDGSEGYAYQQGRIWRTKKEALRKSEIDDLIAKHRITDREVLEDEDEKKYCVSTKTYNNELQKDFGFISTYGISLTEAGVEEIIEKVSKDEWRKFVELAR